MVRVVVQLALSDGMPRPLNGRGHASLFGIWLRERVASIAVDWPAVCFERIEMVADGIRLVLLSQASAPAMAVGLAIGGASRREVQSAALACCGLKRGVVWQRSTVVVVRGETIDERRATSDETLEALVLMEAPATRLRRRRTLGSVKGPLDVARDEGC